MHAHVVPHGAHRKHHDEYRDGHEQNLNFIGDNDGDGDPHIASGDGDLHIDSGMLISTMVFLIWMVTIVRLILENMGMMIMLTLLSWCDASFSQSSDRIHGSFIPWWLVNTLRDATHKLMDLHRVEGRSC